MSHTVAHALAQLVAAVAAFEAHPLKATTKRDRAFIAANMRDSREIAEDGGAFDIEAARAFHVYITTRTLKAHRVAWAVEPVAPVSAEPARAPIVRAEPSNITPMPRNVQPVAARAIHRAYNGHRNICTPDVLGYAKAGPWAVEVSCGEGFRDRATGLCPEMVGVSVVRLDTCRPVHSLSRMVDDRADAKRYLGWLVLLAEYRTRRAAALARIDLARVGGPAGWYDANARHAARLDLADLRERHRDTLATFGRDLIVSKPAPAAPAMVPQVAQQQQATAPRRMGVPAAEVAAAQARLAAKRKARAEAELAAVCEAVSADVDAAVAEFGPYISPRLTISAPRMVPMPAQQQQANAGRFTDDVHTEAAGWLSYVAAHAETAGSVAGFDAAVTEAVDTLLRRHAITPRAAACLLTFFDVPREPVVAAIVPAMVSMPAQQQQARHALVSGKPARRGMARSEGDGTWQVGIYCLARNDAGAWVATATGPGTIGDGYIGTWPTWAAAYEGVTGERAPGAR